MILVDTPVWVDHLRTADAVLQEHLGGGSVLVHPAVIGELALGRIAARVEVLDSLHGLPRVASATDAEVLSLIDRHDLAGSGIGWVDAHLLASTLLTAGARLWSRDRRLHAVAQRLAISV